MKKYADRLKQALAESHALAQRLDEPDFPLTELELLQDWQRQRLALCRQHLVRHMPQIDMYIQTLRIHLEHHWAIPDPVIDDDSLSGLINRNILTEQTAASRCRLNNK